ncbi:Uncharacterized protein BP5553_09797 [Venustampulla echinocandica]|uniref:DUF8004 domain-containing protein n=1 Tax=Venustampulla echinocandica TaxID=2656787 RepID=A0A370TAS3_9HELO|nr:Uncharacterized protein BP5553_09797 [Venustampulla echinocandica]RDL31008.1 Uncharacterized protein BP5553_09797 [Venustampulla echinocandica]
MSGRSAHVRKEKVKLKAKKSAQYLQATIDCGSDRSRSIIGDFPMSSPNDHQGQFQDELVFRPANDNNTIRTGGSGGSSGMEDLAYARGRKPHAAVLDASGTEKSTFRSMMDKKSEGVRKGLAKTFGKKKKNEDVRPSTSASIRPTSHETDAGESPFQGKLRQRQLSDAQDHGRPSPPQGKLPGLPHGSQLKRWMGSGRAPQPWNKLRKDPELWDPNGDTLVFFGHGHHNSSRPPPSFRLSSHVLEATDSRYLITLLRDGSTDDNHSLDMSPSPISSPIQDGTYQTTPPMSEYGGGGYDGQISYEIHFPTPTNYAKTDILRHQTTTRNIFALLYQASLVGLNLYQALTDLHERLEVYMPPDTDTAGMIIDYLVSKGIDDVRDNAAAATSILAWSESQCVRWEEGWREAYVHSVGMYSQLESYSDFKFVTPITKALLERASLEVQVRIQNCEDRLLEFDFEDMWPKTSAQLSASRASFERLRDFIQQHYQSVYETWPPPTSAGAEQWLTRDLAQSLQKDFGALYEYLVNREVVWDCAEERSGRKWNIVYATNKALEADTPDLPMTDILIAFDNRHRYPHIPHPYPLTPEPVSTNSSSRESLFKAGKKGSKQTDDKMAERRTALAYTESTNIYQLGSDFVTNELVDDFVRFEKGDQAGDIDPYAARRGRWVLIYGILQTLAPVSVETPNLRYKKDVSYHLNPRLGGTPPWKGANQNVLEASHDNSYCWAVQDTWHIQPPVSMARMKPSYRHNASSTPPPVMEGDAPSVRSPTLTSTDFDDYHFYKGPLMA